MSSISMEFNLIYSLCFDYNLNTVTNSGRHWAKDVYKDRDYIFSYTAASIATILHHNPKLHYRIYTDDCDLILSKVKQYNVSVDYLDVFDLTKEIREWQCHSYSFWPLAKIVEMNNNGKGLSLKLDNDLTCLKPIDDLLKHNGAIAWKYERMCSAGREYWGERKAARVGLGTDEFPIFNTGVLGLSPEYHEYASEIVDYCQKLISVDISDVSYFPDAPGKKTSVWNASEQTAVNYFFHKRQIPILESHPWFKHWCYEKTKQGVLDSASYLLK
jgi:hypothetical protein